MNRPTSFALHIRPLFREIDITSMASVGPFSIDLTSYDQVRAKSALILARLRDATSPMPPEDFDGPWPEEWIDLFERWINEDHPE